MGRFYDTSTIVDKSKFWYSEPNIHLPMYNNGGFIHYSHVSYGFDGAKKHFAIVVGKQLKQFKQSQGLIANSPESVFSFYACLSN